MIDTRRASLEMHRCTSRKVTTTLTMVVVAIILAITLGVPSESVSRITLENEKVTPPTARAQTLSVEVPRGDFSVTVPASDDFRVTLAGVAAGPIVITVDSLRDDKPYALYTGEALSYHDGKTTYFWVGDNRPDKKVRIEPYEWPHPDGGRLTLHIAPV